MADWLGVPTHVLRFWESKFEQISPVKGAGGRRYYRPDDMRLLGGIKVMLHDQGLTIRGVSQKIDDEGVESVLSLSPDLDAVETPPQRTRRVIRPGDEKPATAKKRSDATSEARPDPETSDATPDPKVVAFDRATPAPPQPADAVVPPQPDAPDIGETEPQPVDVEAPPQPVDPGDVTPPQPEPETTAPPAVPGSTPKSPPADERGPAPDAPATPDDVPPATDGPAAPAPGITLRAPGDRRRLRRIVRRLRGLIEEVEEELSDGARR
ncbi:MerR family transcriptional regulator [Jannaschia marina]|uniref:MerR family transcriptional regulator n=1 Tax=Jannaschia marina TaxID=2741674 RepID=UPI002E296210|nr:MerR family transcriptional regulator [Jannaschia marina]